jgi:transcriptional regulator with XRE-family HTH domain
MRSLADRLREIAGATPQKVVVVKSGLGSDQVSKIWSGETRDPRWSTMVQLLRNGLGVSLDEFVGGRAVSSLSAYDADERYAQLIAKLHALPKREREKAIELISWVLERRQQHETQTSPSVPPREDETPVVPQGDTRRLLEAVKRLDEPAQRAFFEQLANERDVFDALRLKPSEYTRKGKER